MLATSDSIILGPRRGTQQEIRGVTGPSTPPVFVNALSVDFDGTNDFVDIPRVAALDPTVAISVFCWVKGTPQSNKRFGGHFQTVGNLRKWNMGTSTIANTDKLSVALSGNGTGNFKQRISTIPIMDGTWHFVGFTFEANTLLLYIDGVAVATTSPSDSTINTMPTSSADLEIGSQNEGALSFYTGRLDEWSIWDKELTPSEISAIYNSGIPIDLSTHSASGNLINWLRLALETIQMAVILKGLIVI